MSRTKTATKSVKQTISALANATTSITQVIEETAGMSVDVVRLERKDVIRNKIMDDTTDYVVGNMENQRVAKSLIKDFDDLDSVEVDATAKLLEAFLKNQLATNLAV